MVRLRSPAPVLNMGEFPSGQRGQTVNLLSLTSLVRIQLPPPNKDTDQMVGVFVCREADGSSGAKRTLCRIPQAQSESEDVGSRGILRNAARSITRKPKWNDHQKSTLRVAIPSFPIPRPCVSVFCLVANASHSGQSLALQASWFAFAPQSDVRSRDGGQVQKSS